MASTPLRLETIRRSSNRMLSRVTGYRLVKDRLPSDFDKAAQATIRSVKPFTLTNPEKLYALINAVRHVCDHEIPGSIVECGVWSGGSMQAAALTLLERQDVERELYLFDTFDGMTEPSPEDRTVGTDTRASGLLATADPETSAIWARASLQDVKDGFARVPYPPERIHYVAGDVEETIPRQAPESIAVLRLDTDWYASTKHELEHLYPRVVPGGVVIVDDYGHWQGARLATDEFLRHGDHRLLLVRVSAARVAVTP
jgi:O-methyltransferase